jgi:hypothetical protein
MAFSSELWKANSVIEAPGAHLIKPDSAWLVKDIFFRRRLPSVVGLRSIDGGI